MFETKVTNGYGVLAVYCRDKQKRSGVAEATKMPPDGSVVYFNRLYVKAEARRQGMAKHIMNIFVMELDNSKKDCICEINPYGDMTYEQLKKFYESYGFKEQECEYGKVLLRKHNKKVKT